MQVKGGSKVSVTVYEDRERREREREVCVCAEDGKETRSISM